MACTIDATAGGADANSYITIADADAYFATHLYSDDWEGTTPKCQSLQMATRLLDQWFEWFGVIATDEQRLGMPRIGLTDAFGRLLPADEIPEDIAIATAELGKALIAKNLTADSDTETQGVKRVKAGSVEVEFRSVTAKAIPDAVMINLSRYGTLRTRTGGAVTMRRA